MNPTHNYKDSLVWAFVENGMRVRAVQKKNKHGLLLEKIYLYTENGGAADYYDTTSFATFSQKYHLERMIGMKLEEPEI